MSDCPSYLGVSVMDRLEDEELFRYDFLIFCPSSFNATVKIPNKGLRHLRSFEVRLADARKTTNVFLTHMIREVVPFERHLKTTYPRSTTEEFVTKLIYVVVLITCFLGLGLFSLTGLP